MRRLHTWAGLLVFVHLAIYSIVGLNALAGAGMRDKVPYARTSNRDFTRLAGETDAQVAERVCRLLGLTLALPVNSFALQHDPEQHLVLDLWHVNGHHRVTVFAEQRRLRIEEFRVGVPRYLTVLHMTTAVFRSGDWRMTAWAWWNELALWCVLWMILSGIWIWIVGGGAGLFARKLHRWTGLLLALPLMLYLTTAIPLAHRKWWTPTPAIAALHRSTSNAWMSTLLAVASLGLFALAASGIWLSLRNPRERRGNVAVLIASVAGALFLVISMRL